MAVSFGVLFVVEDGADENLLPFVIDKGDNAVHVTANIEHGFAGDLVARIECLLHIGKMMPLGPRHGVVPVEQRPLRPCMFRIFPKFTNRLL